MPAVTANSPKSNAGVQDARKNRLNQEGRPVLASPETPNHPLSEEAKQLIAEYNDLKAEMLDGALAIDPRLLKFGTPDKATIREFYRTHEAAREKVDLLQSRLINQVIRLQHQFETMARQKVDPEEINLLIGNVHDEKLRENLHRTVQSALTDMNREYWQGITEHETAPPTPESLPEDAGISPLDDVRLGNVIDAPVPAVPAEAELPKIDSADESLIENMVFRPQAISNKEITADIPVPVETAAADSVNEVLRQNHVPLMPVEQRNIPANSQVATEDLRSRLADQASDIPVATQTVNDFVTAEKAWDQAAGAKSATSNNFAGLVPGQ